MPISWNLSYAWYGGKFLSATGSQERKLYPGKSYSFEWDAFQVLSFYAKKGCDIIDFWIRLFLHFTGQVTSNQNELSDQYILGLLWYAMDFLNRAISRRLVFSHENAIWIDWNPRAISVTILSKTHFRFGSDLVTGIFFVIFKKEPTGEFFVGGSSWSLRSLGTETRIESKFQVFIPPCNKLWPLP